MAANATGAAERVRNASLVERLELGELLNPEGIATHTILAGKRAQEVQLPPLRTPPGAPLPAPH